VLDLWLSEGLRNVRFTGGEPTIYAGLKSLVSRAKAGGCERVAISTNGSAPTGEYDDLMDAGVDDFSISLDGGCCSIGDEAAGVPGAWASAVETIRHLAQKCYVTVGMVFTEGNVEECLDAVLFADSLGPADIRVIPSAQYNKALRLLSGLHGRILERHPILAYRVNNITAGRHVRGLRNGDCGKCWLGLDDMAVAGGKHYPCIIHLREGGDPIGEVGQDVRTQREEWVARHDPHADPICAGNCLDVCVDYNNAAQRYRDEETQ